MLHPPRKLTGSPVPKSVWAKVTQGDSSADSPTPHMEFSTTEVVYDSPNHFHERDAPARRPTEAWKSTHIASSVEAEGSPVNKGVTSALAQPFVNSAVLPRHPEEGSVQSVGMFKVFRPHDQKEWWKVDNIGSSKPTDRSDLALARDPADIVAARLPFTTVSGYGQAAIGPEFVSGVLGKYEMETAADALRQHKVFIEEPSLKRSMVFGGQNNSSATSRVGLSGKGQRSVAGYGNGLNASPSAAAAKIPASDLSRVGSVANRDTQHYNADSHYRYCDSEVSTDATDDAVIASDKYQKALQHIEALKQQVAQTKRQLVSATHIADKYERMLGPLDHFTSQQVQLREELVKLRDEVVMLLEKDGQSQDRIAQLEATVRKAGYTSLASAAAPNSSSAVAKRQVPTAPQPERGNKTFIYESQQRIDELQARLQRALVVRSQIGLQLADAERLSDTYRRADDTMSPEKVMRRDDGEDGGRDRLGGGIQQVALLDTSNHHTWQMRGRRAALELKLRTQDGLIESLTSAITLQREVLGSEQGKLDVGKSAESYSPNSDPAAKTRPSSPDRDNISSIKERSATASKLLDTPKDMASFKAAVKPGADAEIQRLLAVVNTKNEQIVQLRALLVAVSQSGRMGLSINEQLATSNTHASRGLTPPAANTATASPMRSLQPTDLPGQLLQIAGDRADVRDGITFMTNSEGERALPSDILYPHQRMPPPHDGGAVGSTADPVIIADQLWKMETENASLNRRCTEMQVQLIDRNARIKELERQQIVL